MARKRLVLNRGLTAKHLGDVQDHADHASIGQGKGPPGSPEGPYSRGKDGGKALALSPIPGAGRGKGRGKGPDSVDFF